MTQFINDCHQHFEKIDSRLECKMQKKNSQLTLVTDPEKPKVDNLWVQITSFAILTFFSDENL